MNINQKGIAILIICLIVIALGSYSYSRIASSPSDIPSPSPSELIFNTGQATATPAQTPSTRQIKQYRNFPGVLTTANLQNKVAVIETKKGTIAIEIYPEATKAASNFIQLTRDGFYDGVTFHRVEPGFVVQGGDPLGTGSGGPGYKFEDEPVTKPYNRGIVAMANSGPNTNGSQFFIMLDNHPELPPKYTIFGKVLQGMEVVDKLAVGDVMSKVTIQEISKAGP